MRPLPHGGDLRPFFEPRSIAIVGASGNDETLSGRPLRYLAKHGYAGRVYPVNPHREVLHGHKVYPTVSRLPEAPDLVAICVPAKAVEDVLAECAHRGCRAALVLSSGFREAGAKGLVLERRLQALAARHGLRLLGPNCEGLLHTAPPVALSFSPALATCSVGGSGPEAAGGISIISQSGGLGFAALTAAATMGLEIRDVLSTGNECDVDALELADYMVERVASRVLVLIIEGLRRPRGLEAIAGKARARGKHVVVAKLGMSEAGRRAVTHHTGTDAGNPSLYRALFDHCGVLTATDLEELLDLMAVLSHCPPAMGRRVGIVTSSGGAGVWLADTCENASLGVPELSSGTQRRLEALLPSFGSAVNPVDMTAQAVAEGRLSPAVRCVMESGDVDAVVVGGSLSSPGRLDQEEAELAALVKAASLPLLFFSYTRPDASAVNTLREVGIPLFSSPTRVATALLALSHQSTRPPWPAIVRLPPDIPITDLVEAGGLTGNLMSDDDSAELLGACGLLLSTEQHRPASAHLAVHAVTDPVFGSYICIIDDGRRILDWQRCLVWVPVSSVRTRAALASLTSTTTGSSLSRRTQVAALVDLLEALATLIDAKKQAISSVHLDAIDLEPEGLRIKAWRLTSGKAPEVIPADEPQAAPSCRISAADRSQRSPTAQPGPPRLV